MREKTASTDGGADSELPADNSQENAIIGSLGEALAGVALGSTTAPNNTFSFHDDHNSGAPFNLNSQQPGQGGDIGGGWSFNNDVSGAQGADETKTGTSDPMTPQSRTGNQGIDLFLSQSPSQMLGNDVFKLSSNNLHALDMPQEASATDPFRQQPISQPSMTYQQQPPPIQQQPQQQQQQQQHRGGGNTESPSNLTGTTTSSRSGSPYQVGGTGAATSAIGSASGVGSDASRSMHAYRPNSGASNAENQNRSHPGAGEYATAPGQNNNMMGYSTNSSGSYDPQNASIGGQQVYGNLNAGYGGVAMPGAMPKQATGHAVQHGQGNQQQVLYMAVPTSDGRGQVLQPVQMVQLPGKSFAYVYPGQPGGMPVMQPPMPGVDPNQAPMMLMPGMNMPTQVHPAIGTSMTNNMSGHHSGNKTHLLNGFSHGPPTENSQFDEGLGVDGTRSTGGYNSNVSTGPTYQGNAIDPQDPLASLYNSSQRPSLEALLGQVRRLSRDQVGCRLVQQALDEEGPETATAILREGLPFWGEAMVDPFGNYLFQKILEKITPEERIIIVKSVGSRLVNASLNLHGTRSVQKIVELCSLDERSANKKGKVEESAAEILTRSLAPAAARLCIDSHGNHVIQRILLKLEHKYSKFVFDAVAESVGDVARHRHGCCVIQRCLDAQSCPARVHLVEKIVEKSLELMQDAYGNYVVQYVLDVCSDEDVHAVCESVVGKVTLLAIQKFSSNVMEKCLERCTDTVKEKYLRELSDTDRIRELMMDPFGNYVVQRALSVATHVQAVRLVEAMRPHLTATQAGAPNGHRNGGVRNTAGGRRIMAKICRRFPNFNLNGVGTNEELYSQNKNHQRQNTTNHDNALPANNQYRQYSQNNGQQRHVHHQQHPTQRYNANHPVLNASMPPQFDQRQSQAFFGLEQSGYLPSQSQPHHMGNMGNGAYSNGY